MRTGNVPRQQAGLIEEVAGPVRERRHRYHPSVKSLRCPRALVVREKEDLILSDRSANRTTELILPVRFALRRKKSLGVQYRVSQKVKSAAVKAICPRLGHHIHDTAAIVAVLGVEVVGQNPEFGDRIEIGND